MVVFISLKMDVKSHFPLSLQNMVLGELDWYIKKTKLDHQLTYTRIHKNKLKMDKGLKYES